MTHIYILDQMKIRRKQVEQEKRTIQDNVRQETVYERKGDIQAVRVEFVPANDEECYLCGWSLGGEQWPYSTGNICFECKTGLSDE